MRRNLAILSIILAATFTGCARFNPRLDAPVENNGKIDDLRNNQNGIMAEIGKLQQNAEIQESVLKEVQNGILNLNTAISRNENSGIQILQGDGSLILIFSIVICGMILYFYRDKAIRNEKLASLMAKEIAQFNDPKLNDNILRSATNKNCQKQIFKMLKDLR